MEEGFIKTLQLGKNFCFIAVNGGGDVFAHRSDFRAMDWDEQLLNRRVRFSIITSDGKTRAVNVQPA